MNRRIPAVVIALLVLNAVLRLGDFYGGAPGGFAVLVLPVPELFVILTVYISIRSGRGVHLAGVLGAAVLASLTLFVLGEAFYRAIFREAFSPLEELRFLPAFLEMITGRAALNSTVGAITAVAVIAVIPALLYALLLNAGRRCSRAQAPFRHAITAVAIAAVIISVVWIRPASATMIAALRVPPESPPTFATSYAGTGGDEAVSESATARWEWPDAPISILVLESYGHTLFSREDHRDRIAPTYRRLSATLQDADVHVMSGFLESPAFGGRSWLADGTILAGQWLGNQRLYDAILESDASNLVRYLNAREYRSVLAAPAMTYFDEGWLDFYAFERALVAGDYGYGGPVFDFGRFNDQYLLNVLASEQGEPGDPRPRFLMAILVSTHVPFRVVPPYIEDWSTIGDGSIYHELGRQTFNNNWLTGGEYPEGYTASFDYTLQVVVDYVIQFGREDELFLVLGDHQPRIPISEQTATFSVPFHVMSRNRELLQPFRYYGLEPGLVPSQPAPHPRMDRIYPMLREVIEGGWQGRRDIVGASYTLRKKQSP